MENININSCRLCYKNSGKHFIFDGDNLGIPIITKIGYCCTKICILKNDGLPVYICSHCNDELEGFYRFILRCEASDKKLRLMLNDLRNEERIDVKIEASEEIYNKEFINDTSFDMLDNFCNEPPIVDREETKRYKSRGNYRKQIRKRAGTLTCDVCGRQCPNPSTLEIHMRAHTDEKPFPCKLCEKKYKDLGSLKRHKERHHSGKRERNFICDHCGKPFFSKHDVLIHMRTHTGETPFACSICSKQFTQLSTKLRHQKRHTGERSQVCLTCNKKFCTKEELKNHYLVHTNDKKYSCSICNILFKYKNNLKKHIRRHIDPNRFVCNYCGRVFNLKGNLKIHIDRQHSLKSGQCSVCSKRVSDIEAHMLIHTGERPLKCDHCPKSYFHKNALDRHNNLWHKYPNKFKCAVIACCLSFPSQSMLDFHLVKCHGTIIPFPCDRCSRGFYRKNDLARHKIGTHKERLN